MESSKETPPSTTETNTSSGSYPLPSKDTLAQVAKLAIVEDRPVLFDYWTGSCDGEVIIGVRASGEKLLVKSSDEYTSPISCYLSSRGGVYCCNGKIQSILFNKKLPKSVFLNNNIDKRKINIIVLHLVDLSVLQRDG